MTTIEITVGDTGITLSGQLNGGGLTDLAGCSVKFDLLGIEGEGDDWRLTGQSIVADQTAQITDVPTRKVAYALQTADVSKRARGIMRWTVTTPAGKKIHFPGPKDDQVVLIINP